jgi:alpha-1,3-glucosyltransferase
VHFQYNMLMQALFLLAVHLLQQKRFLPAAITYATLLNFKHIYLYAALAFFAYILKHYVMAA